MRKIFGDPQGNHIEIETRISLLQKKNFLNANKAAIGLADGATGFKFVDVDQDADIVLLRGSLKYIKDNNKTIENPNLSDIDNSVENIDNFEDAIEFLKRENKLGVWANIDKLSKEELIKRQETLKENLVVLNNLIEEKGN